MNLGNLSIEMMHDFIHETIIPDLIMKRQSEINDDIIVTKEFIMKESGLHTICVRTVANWMNQLNFKYNARKKTYYVDGHKAPETVAYWKQYIIKYLKDELSCF